MEEPKKSKTLIALVILLIIITIASVIVATWSWARYTKNTDATAHATVAKWNVTVDTDVSKFSETYTHVLSKKMAPGTSGELDATVTIGTDTEVDVQYNIYIDSVNIAYAETGETGTPAIPTNMIFKDSNGTVISHANMKSGTMLASGTVAAGTGKIGDAAKITPLTWEWPYTTGDVIDSTSNIHAGDAADTLDGEKPVTITITYRVDAYQIQPTK